MKEVGKKENRINIVSGFSMRKDIHTNMKWTKTRGCRNRTEIGRMSVN